MAALAVAAIDLTEERQIKTKIGIFRPGGVFVVSPSALKIWRFGSNLAHTLSGSLAIYSQISEPYNHLDARFQNHKSGGIPGNEKLGHGIDRRI